MARKRYKPKSALPPIVSLIRAGSPVTTYSVDARRMKLRNRAAFNAVATDVGTLDNVSTLFAAASMALTIARLFGHGGHYRTELLEAGDAALAIWERSSPVAATETEIRRLAKMLDVHEAQLDICLVRELDQAITENGGQV